MKDYEASKILSLWEKLIVYFYLFSKCPENFVLQLTKMSQTSHHPYEADQIIRYTVKINVLKYSQLIPKQTFDFCQINVEKWGIKEQNTQVSWLTETASSSDKCKVEDGKSGGMWIGSSVSK